MHNFQDVKNKVGKRTSIENYFIVHKETSVGKFLTVAHKQWEKQH